MSYGTPYIDNPKLYRKKAVGRTFNKMSKTTQTQEPVKASKAKYSKTRGEHAKDILIAMLVTGIIAFIGGMQFSNSQHTAITSAVKAVTPSASAQSVAPTSK
jgi:hypothetical protein